MRKIIGTAVITSLVWVAITATSAFSSSKASYDGSIAVGGYFSVPSLDLFCTVNSDSLYQYRNDPGPSMWCNRQSVLDPRNGDGTNSAEVGISRFTMALSPPGDHWQYSIPRTP